MNEFKLYEKIADYKVKVLTPLLKLLTLLKITPNMITLIGVLGALSFLYTLGVKPLLGFIIFIIAACLDFLDGALARYQKTAHDRGKFIDMLADNLVFTSFVLAMLIYNYVSPLAAALIIYLMLLSKVMRSVNNGIHMQTDWHFTTKAGLFPNLIVWLTYTTFFLSEYSALIVLSLSTLLAIDIFTQFRKILKR